VEAGPLQLLAGEPRKKSSKDKLPPSKVCIQIYDQSVLLAITPFGENGVELLTVCSQGFVALVFLYQYITGTEAKSE